MEDPIQRTTLFPFEKSFRLVIRRAEALLRKEFGCGRREMWILLCIASGDRSQRELGECVGLHPNAVVKLVDGMQKAGLVRRVIRAEDRRENVVEATGEGKSIMEKYMTVKDGLVRQVFRPLTDAQISTWRELAWLVLGGAEPVPPPEDESDG